MNIIVSLSLCRRAAAATTTLDMLRLRRVQRCGNVAGLGKNQEIRKPPSNAD